MLAEPMAVLVAASVNLTATSELLLETVLVALFSGLDWVVVVVLLVVVVVVDGFLFVTLAAAPHNGQNRASRVLSNSNSVLH